MKKRAKNKKHLIIAVCCIVIIIGVILIPKILSGNGGKITIAESDTTVLAYENMQSTISSTGTVESAKSVLVYSTLNYSVESVKVKVGDTVEKGELLAVLDSQSVQDQITSQEISLKQSKKSGQLSIESAQNNYDNFLAGLDEGLNSSLLSAQSQVDSAKESHEKAKLTYDRYKTSLDKGENSALINAQSSLDNAASSLDRAWDTYYDAYDEYKSALSSYNAAQSELSKKKTQISTNEAKIKELEAKKNEEDADSESLENEIQKLKDENSRLENEISSQKEAVEKAKTAKDSAYSKYTSADASLDSAKSSYDSAKASYNAAKRTADETLEDYLSAIDSAWDSYENALTSLKATEKSLQEQLQSYDLALRQAKLGANTESAEESLRQLRVDLAATNIKAPASGTITAVYAKEGSSGSGLLFVIEDLDNLVVETEIKAYDIGSVKIGMSVRIKSENTGERIIEGKIKSIAPTAAKNSQGETDKTSEAAFETVIEVSERDSGLLIGTEADITYILAEEDATLTVPYDAVYTNEEGRDCVIVMRKQNDGSYLLEETEVRLGIDGDLDIAVSGEGVSEGTRVVNEAENYQSLIGTCITIGSKSTMSEDGTMTFPQPGGEF